MERNILTPLLPNDFLARLKVDDSSDKKDYLKYFETQIRDSVRFAAGPYFWFIPDNTQSKIIAVSSNIASQTPHSKEEWLEADVHLFANLVHPDDRYYLLSSIQKAMEIFENMAPQKRETIGLNIYSRLINMDKEFVWKLIQFPGLYFNKNNRVEAAMLMISEIQHIGSISKTMMTIIDNSNDSYKFYTISNENKLIDTQLPKISNREMQVIKLMAAGLPSKSIADKLNLSIYTIENHKRNLRAKTQTKSAAELINFVFINNIL